MRQFLFIILLSFFCIEVFSQDTLPAEDSFHKKNLKLKAGGRLYVDYSQFFPNEEFRNSQNVSNFPGEMRIASAEAFLKGNIFEDIEFTFKADFKGNNIAVKQAFIGYKNLPAIGTIRFGYQYEPFRFSSLSSSKYYPLINKPDSYYFSPKRNMGMVIFNNFLENRISYQLGIFQNGSHRKDNFFKPDGMAISSRLVILPYLNSQKNRLLHLGIGHNFRKPKTGEFEISVPRDFPYVRDEIIPEKTRHVNMLNLETVYIHNSLYWQAEYTPVRKSSVRDSFYSQNIYLQMGWFITGETKNYSGGYSGYDRIYPKRNFTFGESGTGAWELAMRYSETKVRELPLEKEIVGGINWYFNPFSRIMINYSAFRFGSHGSASGLTVRAQVNF